MLSSRSSSRRAWLRRTAAHAALLSDFSRRLPRFTRAIAVDPATAARVATHAHLEDPRDLQALAHRALDAARAAGAQYADVRLTRTVGHRYQFGGQNAWFDADVELVGVGVRALVQGYWGFAACPWRNPEAVVGIARDAVAQARVNATGSFRTVELGKIPIVNGTWATPVQIDPFAVSIEEKLDTFRTLEDSALQFDIVFPAFNPGTSSLEFHRQERVLATSEGSTVTQTVYESGGNLLVTSVYLTSLGNPTPKPPIYLTGFTPAGKGWEILRDAEIPPQLARANHDIDLAMRQQARAKPISIGRYMLVCDGATVAALVSRTLGVATQLDRALGYEANASGTSFLDNPLAMLGSFQVAAPSVTVTANRSAPTQLATVKWDDEAVEPVPFTLVKNGVLTDFQTTREQAHWLAPYYQRSGQPIHSHGCAASEDALGIPMQMMPNLALEPGASSVRLDDLVANVANGVLITQGTVHDIDFQARTGLLTGSMREIKNGHLGKWLVGGAVQFDSMILWKNILSVGGASTTGLVVEPSGNAGLMGNGGFMYGWRGAGINKGKPAQTTSYSVQAVAALIKDQPVINPAKKL